MTGYYHMFYVTYLLSFGAVYVCWVAEASFNGVNKQPDFVRSATAVAVEDMSCGKLNMLLTPSAV